jgi:hypothetical protein
MKAIIDGKTYDTETAIRIGDIGSATNDRRDFNYWIATLYRTRKGRYFMAGEGNARSPFSRTVGQNEWSGGSGIVALTTEEALACAERDLDADTIAEHFADHVEEG